MNSIWIAVLEDQRALFYQLSPGRTHLALLKELPARPGADGEGMLSDMAKFISFQAEKDQFEKIILVTEPRRAGRLAAGLTPTACRRYHGSVMLSPTLNSPERISAEVLRLYGVELGFASAP